MYNMHINMNSLGLEEGSVDQVHTIQGRRPGFDPQDLCEKHTQRCAPALSVLGR